MNNIEFKPQGVVPLREEFMALTKGEIIDSLLLNQFIYWLPKLSHGIDKYIQEEQKRDYTTKIHLTKGWMYKSVGDLAEELFLTESSRKRIESGLTRLIEGGWVERRRNPFHAYDRTYQYRVNLRKVKTDLNNMGYELQGFQFLNNIPEDKKEECNVQKEDSHNSTLCNQNQANPLISSNIQNAQSWVRNAQAIPKTTTEIKKEGAEKIILQESVDNFKQSSETLSSSQVSLDSSLQRVNDAHSVTNAITSNKISSDYRPIIEKESKIKAIYKCSDNAYELALKEFILHYEAKSIESPNWDNLFEKWCLNRTQWREKPVFNAKTESPTTSPAEVVQNNIKRRLTETERNVFSYIASIITPEEYILHGFLLLKLDDLKGNYGVFSHISRDICSLLSANYMDKLKMSLQAFMPEIQEVRLVAKA